MRILRTYFSVFMRISLIILFSIVSVVSFGYFIYKNPFNTYGKIILFLFGLVISILFYFSIRNNINYKKLLTFIVLFGVLVRVIWNISTQTIPHSDFADMYKSSEFILNGDFSMFKGTSYYARFPHLTILVLYFAFIRSISLNPLVTIKIINILIGIIPIILTYFIVDELFNSKKKAIVASYVASIFPPFVTYSSTIVGENIAIVFFMLSLFLFIRFLKNKQKKSILMISGIVLSVGNLFRMVGLILLIAYIIYILVYFGCGFKKTAQSICIILISFYIPLYIVNSALLSSNITEYNLWKGAESKWTSILKGTNIEHLGRWNSYDAEIPQMYGHDYDKVEQASKNIVYERLRETSKLELGYFYIRKFVSQWMFGDFGGTYWATVAREDNDRILKIVNNVEPYINLFFSLILISCVLGLFFKNNNLEINLIYIILGGFILQCLITENQARYGYIASFIFLILPFSINTKKISEFIIKKQII